MLNYLYTLDYDDDGEAASVANYSHDKDASEILLATTVTEEQPLSAHDPPDYTELLNNIAVYAIADKYDIPELEVLAATKFEKALPCSGLVQDLASLPAIVDAVFDTTPDTKCGLRTVVTNFCKDWKEEIIDNEDSVATVRDHGEIGLAMIRQIFDERNLKVLSTADRTEEAVYRERMFTFHIEKISYAAKSIKVPNSREVQQNFIDAQRRRLRELRDAIQEARDYFDEE